MITNSPNKIAPLTDVSKIRPFLNGLVDSTRGLDSRITKLEHGYHGRTSETRVKLPWTPVFDITDNTIYSTLGGIQVKAGNNTTMMYPTDEVGVTNGHTVKIQWSYVDGEGSYLEEAGGGGAYRADIIHFVGNVSLKLNIDGTCDFLWQMRTATTTVDDTALWNQLKPGNEGYFFPANGGVYNSFTFPIGYIDLRGEVPLPKSFNTIPYYDITANMLSRGAGGIIPFLWDDGESKFIKLFMKAPLYGRTIGGNTNRESLLDDTVFIDLQINGCRFGLGQVIYSDSGTSFNSICADAPTLIYAEYTYSASGPVGTWEDGDITDTKLKTSALLDITDSRLFRRFAIAQKNVTSPSYAVGHFGTGDYQADWLPLTNGICETVNYKPFSACPPVTTTDDPP